MDLFTLAALAEVFGLITILSAAIYSWIQIRELKKVRRSQAALSVSELFQSTDFAAGVKMVSSQPNELNSFEEFKKFHGEGWEKAFSVINTWESIGALVHRGNIDFYLIYDFFSGYILYHHKVCENMILNDRQTIGDQYCEWFTWLAERIGEYENKENSPKAAHIEYADWQAPPRSK